MTSRLFRYAMTVLISMVLEGLVNSIYIPIIFITFFTISLLYYQIFAMRSKHKFSDADYFLEYYVNLRKIQIACIVGILINTLYLFI